MSIVENRQARFNYHIEETIEAGLVLEGWEVKAIRAKRVSLTEGYVIFRDKRPQLIGCRIDALTEASSHVVAVPDRTRDLLLHKKEAERLAALIAQKGMTVVPLNLHYKDGRVKIDIGLAKGKNAADKRDTIKERDWKKEQGRLLRGK